MRGLICCVEFAGSDMTFQFCSVGLAVLGLVGQVCWVGLNMFGPLIEDYMLGFVGHTCFVRFWRERAAFQQSAFGRSTAGNDVVATIFIRIFFSFFFSPFFPFFFPFFFLRRDLFS